MLSVSQILRSGVTRDAASVLLQQAGDYLMVGRLPGGNEKTLTLHMGRLQRTLFGCVVGLCVWWVDDGLCLRNSVYYHSPTVLPPPLAESFLALEPLLAATTIPPPAVCVPQFTPAFSTIPAQLLTNVRASQPVRPPSFPTIDKPMSYLISTGPPASLVSATSPTMMIDNSTRFPSQPIKPLSSTQMHHHQQQYYAHPQPYTQLQVQPQPHKQNIPMDPSALADAVALLSHTHPPNVHIVAISQADSTRALPRQHTNNSATHRSNDSPGSSDGRRSRGSMPFGNALGNGASSSSSFTTSATMQVLCTEQPQPGVLCKGASEAGACVLSVLATKERVGVLLVCIWWWTQAPCLYSSLSNTAPTLLCKKQVSVPSDPPVCFSIPLEPMLSQCATILPPTWIHTELTLLLADDSVQKVLHNGRLVGGVLQLLHLSLGARVLDTKVLGMQLHAMYAACDTASPDGVVAAVMMDVEGALAHNGIQVAAPSAAGMVILLHGHHTGTLARPPPPTPHVHTDLAALTVEQQHNPLQWAVCPAMPLQLLMAAQQDLATLLLAASLRQLVKALAAGAWAESCSLRYALGQRVILPVAEASTSPR